MKFQWIPISMTMNDIKRP